MPDRMTLAQIRAIYPKAKFPPDPDCRHCKGTGVIKKAEEIAARNGIKKIPQPCACIFVRSRQDKNAMEELRIKTGKLIRKLRERGLL